MSNYYNYNCENPQPDNTCGTYVIPYLKNLEYVSDRLLGIINEHILPDLYDGCPAIILTDSCDCLPICDSCDGITDVFNCVLWKTIKDHLIIMSSDSYDPQGYLAVLSQTLKCVLSNVSYLNHGFAAQLERFLCLVQSLETRLDSICCNNKCPEIIGDLLCLLMQILTKLISAVSKVSTLLYYSECQSKSTYSTGNKVVMSFFECMVCDFVNDLCELEKLIPELSAIVIGFATCDVQSCTPCYTASSTPRKVRPVCPPNMNNGYNNGYGQNYGGCNCKKR